MSSEEIAGLITEVTSQVFSMMLGIEVQPEQPVIEQMGAGPSEGVVALVGLAGPWVGTGTLSCSPDEACWLASKMLGSDYDSVNEDVLDAVGEIANMVIGNLKTNIEERVGPMGLSVPTVVYGRNFTTRSVGKQDWTVVRFDCGEGKVAVQVMLTPAPAPQPHLMNATQYVAPVESRVA